MVSYTKVNDDEIKLVPNSLIIKIDSRQLCHKEIDNCNRICINN